ncbi:MAG: ATP-binding protein, partial [Anaerovoracaceae bacterium]
MSSMLNMGIVVCMLPIVWLTSRFAPEYIWYSIPASIWLLLLITLGTTWYISRRNKGLHWFFLTQTSSNIHWITYSVKFEKEDVEIKLNKLLSFIESYKFPRKLYLDIHHCLEELMYNEVEMASITGKHGAFDISIHNQQEKISVIIKDVGKPYNPIIKYSPNHIDDIDPSQLSMLLVNGLCENINYKYMNGLNCLYLNFEKKIR